MNLTQSTTKVETPQPPEPTRTSRLRTLLTTWELYPIIALAAFLRLYQINITEFDDDQAVLFRMAYNAIHHGLLPIMSNGASIGIAQPPGVIFFYMIPAFFSSNPLGGVLLTALLTLAAVIFTYIFTRRYYGRTAATIAALLYGTAAAPVHYARFIWQPNIMPLFTILFIFALFWGVIERRKGWFIPALLLLGLLYQMHEVTLLLIVPLAVAVIFAFQTLRWRDLLFSLIALIIIFFPYLLWELYTKFTDIHTILMLSKQESHVDSQAIQFYRLFLVPFTQQPTYPGSLMQTVAPLLSWLLYLMPALAISSTVFALVCLAVYFYRAGTPQGAERQTNADTAQSKTSFRTRWHSFAANPYGGGLTLLLLWLLLPLIVLSRHSIALHTQYFFVLMPAPFILIGIFAAQMIAWSRPVPTLHLARYGIYVLVVLITLAQFTGTISQVIDIDNGNYDGRNLQIGTYYNDFNTLQQAINDADQQAQQHHLSHIYIASDFVTRSAESYLLEHTSLHTSATLFDVTSCLVLPAPATGPAIMLVSPYDTYAIDALRQFATLNLLARPYRLGGPPFQLYMVTPLSGQPSSQTFINNLQFVDSQTYISHAADGTASNMLAMRWTLLRSAPTTFSDTYTYAFTLDLSNGKQIQSTCSLTSLHAGDQLISAFRLPANTIVPQEVSINAEYYTTYPDNPSFGPLHLEIDGTLNTPATPLTTPGGSTHLTVST